MINNLHLSWHLSSMLVGSLWPGAWTALALAARSMDCLGASGQEHGWTALKLAARRLTALGASGEETQLPSFLGASGQEHGQPWS